MTRPPRGPGASGTITVIQPVEIVSVRRGRVEVRIDGWPRTLRAGDTLMVTSYVIVKPEMKP